MKLETYAVKEKLRRVPLPVWIVGLAVVVAFTIPIAYLVVRALEAGMETWELVFRIRTLKTMGRTLALVVAAPLLSLAIALPLAVLTTRTNLPFRKTWSVLTVLPLVIPSYLYAFVLISAFRSDGLVGFLSSFDIRGFPGALLCITAVSYPYLLLPMRASLKGMDFSLEEASKSLGHGHLSTFRKVTLPLLRPAIASGSLLIALYALRDFGAISLMGYETFTWMIYSNYQMPFGGRMVAAGLSLILLLVAFSLLFMETKTRSKAKYHVGSEGSSAPDLIELGRWRWPAFLFCGFIVSAFLIFPMVVLGYWVVRGISAGQSLQMYWGAAFNSLFASGLAALTVVLAAIPIALLTTRFSGKLSKLIEKSTYIGFALPGVVIALALVIVFVGTPLYQTIFVLIFGYMILFLPLAVGSIRTSLLQINPTVEEVSRSLGKSAGETIGSITLPLSKYGILAGGTLVFLVTMKELQATLLLGPLNFETLATSIWHTTSEAFFARAAIAALPLVLLSSVPMMILLIFWHRRGNYERISGSL